jgi:hypothetical protein
MRGGMACDFGHLRRPRACPCNTSVTTAIRADGSIVTRVQARTGAPLEVVVAAVEEAAAMFANARVTTFVSILVERHALSLVRSRAGFTLASELPS